MAAVPELGLLEHPVFYMCLDQYNIAQHTLTSAQRGSGNQSIKKNKSNNLIYKKESDSEV